MERALAETIRYVKERRAFGKTLFDFQNTQFKLAECATEVAVGRVFVDHCVSLLIDGKLDSKTASMAKLWLSEREGRVLDECLQLFGGYGYMAEYPIAGMWTVIPAAATSEADVEAARSMLLLHARIAQVRNTTCTRGNRAHGGIEVGSGAAWFRSIDGHDAAVEDASSVTAASRVRAAYRHLLLSCCRQPRNPALTSALTSPLSRAAERDAYAGRGCAERW